MVTPPIRAGDLWETGQERELKEETMGRKQRVGKTPTYAPAPIQPQLF